MQLLFTINYLPRTNNDPPNPNAACSSRNNPRAILAQPPRRRIHLPPPRPTLPSLLVAGSASRLHVRPCPRLLVAGSASRLHVRPCPDSSSPCATPCRPNVVLPAVSLPMDRTFQTLTRTSYGAHERNRYALPFPTSSSLPSPSR
jgi:hypothetical protein